MCLNTCTQKLKRVICFKLRPTYPLQNTSRYPLVMRHVGFEQAVTSAVRSLGLKLRILVVYVPVWTHRQDYLLDTALKRWCFSMTSAFSPPELPPFRSQDNQHYSGGNSHWVLPGTTLSSWSTSSKFLNTSPVAYSSYFPSVVYSSRSVRRWYNPTRTNCYLDRESVRPDSSMSWHKTVRLARHTPREWWKYDSRQKGGSLDLSVKDHANSGQRSCQAVLWVSK